MSEFWYIEIAAMFIGIYIGYMFRTFNPNSKWKMQDTGKRGGSYNLFYKDQHYANVRGKAKASKIIDELGGSNPFN